MHSNLFKSAISWLNDNLPFFAPLIDILKSISFTLHEYLLTHLTKNTFLWIVGIYAGLFFFLLFLSFWEGQPIQAASCVLLGSAIPMLLAGAVMEQRFVFDLAHQAFGFAFGDTACLPIMAIFLAIGMQGVPKNRLPNIWLLLLIAAAISILAAGLFRITYMGRYDMLTLWSPTKIIHDFIACTVLPGPLVVTLVITLWFPESRGWAIAALVCALCWFGLNMFDILGRPPVANHVPYIWPNR